MARAPERARTSIVLSDSFSLMPARGRPVRRQRRSMRPCPAVHSNRPDGSLRRDNQPVRRSTGAPSIDQKPTGTRPHREVAGTLSTGTRAHREVAGTLSTGTRAHREVAGTLSTGTCPHREVAGTLSTGTRAHREVAGTLSTGTRAHREVAAPVSAGARAHREVVDDLRSVVGPPRALYRPGT
jgi:hypothetical protein